MESMGRLSRIIPDIRVILCNKGVQIDGDVRLINLQQIFCNPGLDSMKGTCALRPADICAVGCVTASVRVHSITALSGPSVLTTSPAQWQNYSPGKCGVEHRVNHSSRQKHHGPTAKPAPNPGELNRLKMRGDPAVSPLTPGSKRRVGWGGVSTVARHNEQTPPVNKNIEALTCFGFRRSLGSSN